MLLVKIDCEMTLNCKKYYDERANLPRLMILELDSPSSLYSEPPLSNTIEIGVVLTLYNRNVKKYI